MTRMTIGRYFKTATRVVGGDIGITLFELREPSRRIKAVWIESVFKVHFLYTFDSFTNF